MARSAIGQFLTFPSTNTTHALGVQPQFLVSLGGLSVDGTPSVNTTLSGHAVFAAGFAGTTNSSAQGSVGFTGKYVTSAMVGKAVPQSSAGTLVGAFPLGTTTPSIAGSKLESWATTSLTKESSNVAPVAFVLVGGDDVQVRGKIASAITTVAGTTQASTGWGFTPNAAFFLSESSGSSQVSASVGFACLDSAGVQHQWSIGQSQRAAGAVTVNKVASTARVVSLITTGTTSHDVAVTSFRSDGIELTVNASDTARPATIAVLGLSVPRVHAGKATITTNGVGAGQTGVTVTGLGQNVAMAVLASIGSSLQTLQTHNHFSLGFATSNGEQRSVSGFVLDSSGVAGAAARYCHYFNTTRAVTFTSAGTDPSVQSVGLFAVTTDGFTVTFNNTNANGWDLYYAAFSNVVQDLEAHINSAFTQGANIQEVARLSAAIQSSFSVNANAEPQFIPTEGKVHAQAKIETRTERDDDRTYNVISNSSSPDYTDYMNVTTTPQSLRVANYQNAKHLTIIPPSTNTVPLRLSGSLNSPGFPISSRGQNSIAISERSGNDLYLHTTSTGTTVEGVRIILR